MNLYGLKNCEDCLMPLIVRAAKFFPSLCVAWIAAACAQSLSMAPHDPCSAALSPADTELAAISAPLVHLVRPLRLPQGRIYEGGCAAVRFRTTSSGDVVSSNVVVSSPDEAFGQVVQRHIDRSRFDDAGEWLLLIEYRFEE